MINDWLKQFNMGSSLNRSIDPELDHHHDHGPHEEEL